MTEPQRTEPTASDDWSGDAPHTVTLTVNGVPRSADAPVRRLLSDFLRHDLELTGTHVGCEHGVCGACTVLLDGEPVRSCLIFAVSVSGSSVTTVEGCGGPDGALGSVQQAFLECHGLQCGFCTPGFVTTITAYLEENPNPTEDDARHAIAGNLCRCTGYQNIVASVLRAAELKRTAAGSSAAEPLMSSAGSGAPAAGSSAAEPLMSSAGSGAPAAGPDAEVQQ